ncbi:uncharacterized protein [Drosophila takahashii]|uniref:uncharacterized protein isoform X2 n=1 Tax=Drosophila takahashii TaxID=29030 RepID=UPI001CF8459B|nr:uncharacterized protein LOC108062485 isoform X2 [Drosophila takahashii]
MEAEAERTTTGRLKWTTNMECLLVDLWQDSIAELRGPRKNSHIYLEMAQSMKEAGFNISFRDVRTKLENMTKKYRLEKNKIGPSGGTPSSWQHFDKVHSFLGPFRIHSMEANTLDNENVEEYLEETIELNPENSESPSCSARGISTTTSEISVISASGASSAKRAKQDHLAELVEVARDRLELTREQQKSYDEHQKNQTAILERVAKSQEKFQSELLKFLRESK